ncbi:MAG TPA: hypothetical protein VFW05_07440 [Verrucomicrobiae bacterium]|nr:hypothetical protein [Verrucomicrobiae bacterium]
MKTIVSSLDTLEKFSGLSVFAGPKGSVCATIASKIYAFDNGQWRELFALNTSQLPEVFPDGIIFRRLPTVFQPGNIWHWSDEQSKPELILVDPPLQKPYASQVRNFSRSQSDETPRWKSDSQNLLTGSATAYCRSNLYVFSDHASWTKTAGTWQPLLQDGCHARLFCFNEESSQSSYVPLHFETGQERVPLNSPREKRANAPWLAPMPWITVDSDSIYIGQTTLQGVWRLSLKQIESRLKSQSDGKLSRLD